MCRVDLQYNDDHLRSMIVEGMQDAVIMADTRGVIRLWNRGAEAMFGYTASEAVGASLELIIPKKLRGAHAAGFSLAVSERHLKLGGKVMTTRADAKDGTRLYIDFSFGLLRGGDGEVVGVFAIGRDVTARHLKRAALQGDVGR